MYSASAKFPVYCHDCWWSDKWDPKDYGQDYDPSKPFFDQMQELLLKVPKSGIFVSSDVGPNINSEYANFGGAMKDCYLVFNSGNLENCAYSRGITYCNDVFDSYYGEKIESGYENVNANSSAGIAFSQNVSGCVNCWYMYGCSGCQNCFGCVNLRNKSYHILNQPYSKEEYTKMVKEIKGSYTKMEEFKKDFNKLVLELPHRENNNLKSVKSSGEYIVESKNCQNCFEAITCEDSRNLFSNKYTNGCYDLIGHGRKSELLLEGVAVGTSQRVIGSWWTITSHDIFYSFGMRSCEECFGCDSLRNAKYCILNKQYSEQDYNKIKEAIIAELKEKNLFGLYFPPKIAPFAYNETVGQDNFPLTKEETTKLGYKWQDNLQMTTGKETLKEIPDHINNVDDSITKEILVC